MIVIKSGTPYKTPANWWIHFRLKKRALPSISCKLTTTYPAVLTADPKQNSRFYSVFYTQSQIDVSWWVVSLPVTIQYHRYMPEYLKISIIARSIGGFDTTRYCWRNHFNTETLHVIPRCAPFSNITPIKHYHPAKLSQIKMFIS